MGKDARQRQKATIMMETTEKMTVAEMTMQRELKFKNTLKEKLKSGLIWIEAYISLKESVIVAKLKCYLDWRMVKSLKLRNEVIKSD